MGTMNRICALALATLAISSAACVAGRNAGRAASEAASSAGQKIDDTSINFAVKGALKNDPAVNASDLEVETKNGVVTLKGTVPTQAAANRAAELAAKAEGVTRVVNEIAVKKR
jgi:hyperosmotically inducible protein